MAGDDRDGGSARRTTVRHSLAKPTVFTLFRTLGPMKDGGADTLGGMTVGIRTTRDPHRQAVLRVVREAFSDEGRDGHEEVDIVVETWAHAAPDGLDVVALDEGAVVGHVMAGRGRLGERETLGIAPLSVASSHQRKGIGSALMTELLRRVEAAGWPLIVLLGEPDYYGRLGFERATPLGIVYPPVGPDNDAFQVLRLSRYDDSWRGDFAYCWELAVGT
jgi:predicted N-acetyltransferase YhbS